MKNRQEQKRQYYLKNRERLLLRNKNWDSKNKEKRNQIAKRYRLKNKEKCRTAQLKYCKSAYGIQKRKEYRENNKEKFHIAQLKYRKSVYGIQKKKDYREKNKEKILLQNKEFYEKNRHLIVVRAKIAKKKYKASAKGTETERRYYEENQKKIKIYRKKYYKENKEAVSLRGKINYQKNKEKYKITHKRWYENNKERRMETAKRYERKKYREDINFKIAFNLRRRLQSALRGRDKGISAVRNLGISIEELKLYLGKKFYPHPLTGEKMTWDNYGYYGWHIDHKIPCSSFDLINLEQQKKCFYYTNLQPLWRFDNQSKGNKIILGDITSPKK